MTRATLTAETRDRRGLLLVLLASGGLGFHLGYTRYPDWQVAVETAQVVAGLVVYPPENPFYLYHAKLWTILHQICALLLRAGASEIDLSRLLSGTLGMLSFQAVSAVTWSLSRSVLISSGVAVLIFATAAPETGASYPIFMMGVPFTYGIAGLSLAVLTMALLGSGFQRAGGFLLGIAPAVHPSLGAWLSLIVALAWLADPGVRRSMRTGFPFLIAGWTVTGLSLGIHQFMASRVPGLAVEVSRSYFDGFVAQWDGHRQPISLSAPAVWMNVAACLVATWWLFQGTRDKAQWTRDKAQGTSKGQGTSEKEQGARDGAPVLLRFVQVSALVALALVPLSWFPHEEVPMQLLILMPGRVLNINAFALPALVFGALAAHRHDLRAAILTSALGAGLLVSETSALWRLFPQGSTPGWAPPPHVVTLAAAAGAALLMSPRRTLRFRHAAVLTVRAGSLLWFAAATVLAYVTAEDRTHLFADRTNDGFLFAVSREPGVLLGPGEIYLLQLRTRRPVLIDAGALDTLAYTPESGAAMDRILRDVYGIDLFDPPPAARGVGRLPARLHRRTWEAFSRERWQAIRREYHVTTVLTEGDWLLDLPIVAQSSRYLLYRIP